MLTPATLQKIKEYLQLISQRELQIEDLRQKLAAQRDFEPYTAFLRIEKTGQRRVSSQCLHHFLVENARSQYSVRDCQLMIKYFDIDLDSALNYTEFMQMILPCDNLRLRSEASQREPKR